MMIMMLMMMMMMMMMMVTMILVVVMSLNALKLTFQFNRHPLEFQSPGNCVFNYAFLFQQFRHHLRFFLI